jgi:hypothetical protein
MPSSISTGLIQANFNAVFVRSINYYLKKSMDIIIKYFSLMESAALMIFSLKLYTTYTKRIISFFSYKVKLDTANARISKFPAVKRMVGCCHLLLLCSLLVNFAKKHKKQKLLNDHINGLSCFFAFFVNQELLKGILNDEFLQNHIFCTRSCDRVGLIVDIMSGSML